VAEKEKIISECQLMEFCVQTLQKAGLPQEDAWTVADSLIAANLRGVDSHGVLRLPSYIRRLLDGGANPKPQIQVIRRGASFVRLDGDRGMGQVVGKYAMKETLELASQTGIGVATVCNSDHFGAAAYYAMMALKQDMIGLAITNAAPIMCVWGGKGRFIGNNPIAIAVPAGKEFPIVLDMAVSNVAGGKVRIAEKKGIKIPLDWIVDEEGNPTDDPNAFGGKTGGSLLPLGYKGYGLGVMGEILSGILSGGRILDEMPLWLVDTSLTVGIGHFMLAIHVDAFIPIQEFKNRADHLVQRIHSAPRAKGVERIYLPGEIEHLSELKRRAEGIPVSEAVFQDLVRIGHELNIGTEILS